MLFFSFLVVDYFKISYICLTLIHFLDSLFYFLRFSFTFNFHVDTSKNGAVVGKVYKDMKGPLFPTIAVHSQNEE